MALDFGAGCTMSLPGERPSEFLGAVHDYNRTYVLFRVCAQKRCYYFVGLSLYARPHYNCQVSFDTISALPSARLTAYPESFYTSGTGVEYLSACRAHGRACGSQSAFLSQDQAYAHRRELETHHRRLGGLLPAKVHWVQ